MSEKVQVKEVKQTERQKTKEEIKIDNQKLLKALESQKEIRMDSDKIAELKAKLAQKQQEIVKQTSMMEDVSVEVEVEQPQQEDLSSLFSNKKVSIKMSVLGIGQAGSRIAEQFYKFGYEVGVINTSAQDLEFIDVPPGQKLLLKGTLGGTGKNLEFGREIFMNNLEAIDGFVEKVAERSEMNFLAVSGGGGTGSSSVDAMVPLLYNLGYPVGVIYVLPKATEDAQSKKNSIETLARLAKMTSDNTVSCLIVVDNARIEQIYGGLSQSSFWQKANEAIVEPINLFNTLTAQASKFTALDPSDFGTIISTGDCSVYGMVEVKDYMEETALAEAVIKSLSANMLAEGFDLTQTRTGGVIVVGSEKALSLLPAVNIDYCFSMISEQTNGAKIFQGIYSQDMAEDTIKIFSWFSGLGLPRDRIINLKKESEAQSAVLAEKEKSRSSSMILDLGDDKVVSTKDEIQRKIQQKNSGFNKLQGNPRTSIIDKRRK